MTARIALVLAGTVLLGLLSGCTIKMPGEDTRRLTDWLAGDCDRPEIIIRVPESIIEDTV